jgi:mono/diheme cytochrome c family protein
MVLKIIPLFTFSLLMIGCSNNNQSTSNLEGEETTSSNPQALYAIHCDACHGVDGKEGVSGAADLSISKLSDKEIENTILNGNEKGMMPFKDMITNPKDIKSLVEYVKTLRK